MKPYQGPLVKNGTADALYNSLIITKFCSV